MVGEAGDNMFSAGPGFCFGWEIKLNRYRRGGGGVLESGEKVSTGNLRSVAECQRKIRLVAKIAAQRPGSCSKKRSQYRVLERLIESVICPSPCGHTWRGHQQSSAIRFYEEGESRAGMTISIC